MGYRYFILPLAPGRAVGLTLHLTANRFSSLPQDRVFALYGLLTQQLQEAVPVDYSKSLIRITYDIMAFVFDNPKERRSIHKALRTLWHPPAFSDESRLSWLPDLTYRTIPDLGKLGMRYEIAKQLLNAGEGAVPQLSQDTGALHLDAWNLGTCRVVLEFGHTADVIIDQIASLTWPIPTTILRGSGVIQGVALETPAMCSETASRFQRALDFCCAEAIYLQGIYWEDPELTDDDLFDKVRPTIEKMAGKVAMVTDAGYAGICTEQVQSGDILSASPLYGQALLMRKKLSGACRYRIIGTCVVGGLADDGNLRVVDKAMVRRVLDQEWQQFCIV